MTTSPLRYGRLLLAPALLVASCSQGPQKYPTSATDPLNTIRPGAGVSGVVSGAAVGDVQNGPLEIFNVRVAPEGGTRFFANPGGVYRVEPGVLVEFWVEWRSNVVPANPPRLIITWGFAEPDSVSCGSCLVNKVIPAGLHTITVTLDDRVGGVTRRTFNIDTQPIPPEATGVTHALFANGPGYTCPTGATTFTYTPPLDPTSSAQAKQACEACYGTCYLETADCAGLGWGPRPAGTYVCGEAYFGFTNGCSTSAGRSWKICSSFPPSGTFGHWGLF